MYVHDDVISVDSALATLGGTAWGEGSAHSQPRASRNIIIQQLYLTRVKSPDNLLSHRVQQNPDAVNPVECKGGPNCRATSWCTGC